MRRPPPPRPPRRAAASPSFVSMVRVAQLCCEGPVYAIVCCWRVWAEAMMEVQRQSLQRTDRNAVEQSSAACRRC